MARMDHARVPERMNLVERCLACEAERSGPWWGEAPERPENINEASDVAELQAHTRPTRVPSRGSAMSLVSRFGVLRTPYSPQSVGRRQTLASGSADQLAKHRHGFSQSIASFDLSGHSGASPPKFVFVSPHAFPLAFVFYSDVLDPPFVFSDPEE